MLKRAVNSIFTALLQFFSPLSIKDRPQIFLFEVIANSRISSICDCAGAKLQYAYILISAALNIFKEEQWCRSSPVFNDIDHFFGRDVFVLTLIALKEFFVFQTF